MALGDQRAFRHDGGRPRDRIGEIEVVECVAEGSPFESAAARGQRSDIRPLGGHDLIEALQVGMRLEQRLTQLCKRVVRKLVADYVRQRAQDRPVLARVARGKEARPAICTRPSVLT